MKDIRLLELYDRLLKNEDIDIKKYAEKNKINIRTVEQSLPRGAVHHQPCLVIIVEGKRDVQDHETIVERGHRACGCRGHLQGTAPNLLDGLALPAKLRIVVKPHFQLSIRPFFHHFLEQLKADGLRMRLGIAERWKSVV